MIITLLKFICYRSKHQQLKMCYYQPWEDDSTQGEDSAPFTGNGFEQIEVRWETRLELLEARVARIEARVEGLEARLLFLQKSLRVVCTLFLITLIYAIRK